MGNKEYRKIEIRTNMCNKKKKGGIYAPAYYRDFKCIADRCRHSCCIDWEICIDDATYEKYRHIENIHNTVTEGEDGPCFALREDGRCPHLNESGLCDIIISYGEDHLSEICQKHPRFFNCISGSRTEAGLGIVCEEACRIILESNKSFSLLKIEEGDCFEENEALCYDSLPARDRIISMIEGEGRFDQQLEALKKEFAIPELYTTDEWLDRFLALEVLDPNWKNDLEAMRGRLFCATCENFAAYEKYYGRLLTYFVYRHVSTACDDVDLRARLAFAILSVEMIRSMFESNIGSVHISEADAVPEGLIDIARRYSAEIEYSEDNTEELIFALESFLFNT